MIFWAYPLIEMLEMRVGNLSTAIATFGGRYARELLLKTFYAFLIIIVYKVLHFGHFSQKHYRHTDGRTNGRTHPLIEMRGRI